MTRRRDERQIAIKSFKIGKSEIKIRKALDWEGELGGLTGSTSIGSGKTTLRHTTRI